MLNEERVKHMVKLAFYESKGGSEEIKISSQRKRTYINVNTLLSVIWMTIAYAMIVAFIYMGVLNDFAEEIPQTQRAVLIICMVVAYLALLIFYIVKARFHYKKKHARAYYRVKQFKKDLADLEQMYEEEEIHE